jgi:acyl carrier protein
VQGPPLRDTTLKVESEIAKTLRAVLRLGDGVAPLPADTALLGSVAELDSMAVVSILTALEERFGFVIDDDEVDGRTFASVGSLTRFVQSKLDA